MAAPPVRGPVPPSLKAAGAAASLPVSELSAAGAAVAEAEPESEEAELPEEPQPANSPITMTAANSRHSVFFMFHFSFL